MLFLILNRREIDPYENPMEIAQQYFHVHYYENENINFNNIENINMCWKETTLYIVGSIVSVASICYIIYDLHNLKKSGL